MTNTPVEVVLRVPIFGTDGLFGLDIGGMDGVTGFDGTAIGNGSTRATTFFAEQV
jgi:hypothetical protein